MTRHCYKCGCAWTLARQPGRSEYCQQCGTDLRICLNCTFYDLRAAHQCRERRAEPVHEKHVATFCEYFEFAARAWIPKEEKDARADSARESLKRLLGD